jgi:hypothetical protein
MVHNLEYNQQAINNNIMQIAQTIRQYLFKPPRKASAGEAKKKKKSSCNAHEPTKSYFII